MVMDWIYKNEILTEVPKGYFGFIYRINYTDDTKYIGKKAFYDNTTLPALKNGKVREGAKRIGKNIKGKRTYFDIMSKESKWKQYKGSTKHSSGKTIKSKEILILARTKRELTYLEVKALFHFDAIEDEAYINANILNKFFRDNLV